MTPTWFTCSLVPAGLFPSCPRVTAVRLHSPSEASNSTLVLPVSVRSSHTVAWITLSSDLGSSTLMRVTAMPSPSPVPFCLRGGGFLLRLFLPGTGDTSLAMWMLHRHWLIPTSFVPPLYTLCLFFWKEFLVLLSPRAVFSPLLYYLTSRNGDWLSILYLWLSKLFILFFLTSYPTGHITISYICFDRITISLVQKENNETPMYMLLFLCNHIANKAMCQYVF